MDGKKIHTMNNRAERTNFVGSCGNLGVEEHWVQDQISNSCLPCLIALVNPPR